MYDKSYQCWNELADSATYALAAREWRSAPNSGRAKPDKDR